MEHRRGHAEGASGDHDGFAGWVARDTFCQPPANAERAFEHAAELAGVAPQGRAFQAADHFANRSFLASGSDSVSRGGLASGGEEEVASLPRIAAGAAG